MPACALLYALCCVVNNVGISSVKIDKLSQGCRTRLPELVNPPATLCLGARVHQIFDISVVLILTRKYEEHGKRPIFT